MHSPLIYRIFWPRDSSKDLDSVPAHAYILGWLMGNHTICVSMLYNPEAIFSDDESGDADDAVHRGGVEAIRDILAKIDDDERTSKGKMNKIIVSSGDASSNRRDGDASLVSGKLTLLGIVVDVKHFIP
jgi:hypothetical protein